MPRELPPAALVVVSELLASPEASRTSTCRACGRTTSAGELRRMSSGTRLIHTEPTSFPSFPSTSARQKSQINEEHARISLTLVKQVHVGHLSAFLETKNGMHPSSSQGHSLNIGNPVRWDKSITFSNEATGLDDHGKLFPKQHPVPSLNPCQPFERTSLIVPHRLDHGKLFPKQHP